MQAIKTLNILKLKIFNILGCVGWLIRLMLTVSLGLFLFSYEWGKNTKIHVTYSYQPNIAY
jgi:hypothetical protein